MINQKDNVDNDEEEDDLNHNGRGHNTNERKAFVFFHEWVSYHQRDFSLRWLLPIRNLGHVL